MTEQFERFEDLPDALDGIRRAVKRHQAAVDAAAPATPTGVNGTATVVSDPTFDIRRKQANLCDAVMMRVAEMEAASNAMLEAAKKLRAAVVANT